MKQLCSELTIYLPQLQKLPAALLPKETLPGLGTVFGRGVASPKQSQGFYSDVASAMGLQPTDEAVPIAAMLAAENDQEWWVCADPVHVTPSREHLVLDGQQRLTLTEEEADSFLSTLNAHFAEDGLVFRRTSPLQWQIRSSRAWALNSTPLLDAVGQNIHYTQPQGEDAWQWRVWLNEIQMLFNQHPVNLAKRGRGEREVNSMWFWGEGCRPVVPVQSPQLWSDVAAVDAFARFINGRPAEPFSLAKINNQTVPHYVVFEPPRAELLGQWYHDLVAFDHDVIQPLVDAVRQQQIVCLVIDSGDTQWQLQAKDIKRFWRSKQNLSKWVS